MRTKKENAAGPEKRGACVSAAAQPQAAIGKTAEPVPKAAEKRTERPETGEPEELRALLAAATPDACRLIRDIINDEDAKLELRVKCCEIVLDRVYGKAGQSLGLDARGVAPVLLLGGENVAD